MSTAANEYMQTYTSYSGVDIVGSFNGKVFAELQGITYSISREKAAVYTMGSAEPRSFSRGKRGIAGTLVFTVFDRDALLDEFGKVMQNNEELKIQKFQMNDPNNVNEKTHVSTGFTSIEKWDAEMSALAGTSATTATPTNTVGNLVNKYTPHYADEILPFDITLTMANEYGNMSTMVIYGVEILNEGSGFSTDTVVTEKAYTYVARRIESLQPSDGSHAFASSW